MYIHRETKQVINAIPSQPVSTGTNKIQDLLPIYLHVLQATPEYAQIEKNLPASVFLNEEDEWWNDEGPQVIEELTEALEKYAPEGYRFGNTDNLTDYGYWLCDDALQADGWECTDPDTGQWAKKKDDFSWFYIDNGDGPESATLIDVRKYTIEQIESAINSYGYTLAHTNLVEKREQSIHELYAHSYLQIIAECLFESDT